MIYNIKEQNIESPDDFYEVLVNAHDGLSDDESRRLNAKIILLLANAIGNKDLLEEIILTAQKSFVEQ
ncbi:MAG: DUF2783 domain-containing protein [Thalassobaculaceae bacterium]|jgi:hypothetical protein|nr:DUF2783 domain-containing protein [Alphaproteobacteria bacterium]|tara:strand:+ start:867 stop:1070 length:204 start_codon:yes stop_codon:yes gene_type:complete